MKKYKENVVKEETVNLRAQELIDEKHVIALKCAEYLGKPFSKIKNKPMLLAEVIKALYIGVPSIDPRQQNGITITRRKRR